MNRLASRLPPAALSRFSRFRPNCSIADDAAELGFRRPKFGRENLAGTVHSYDRHVFLCYRTRDTWQANVEISDGLPGLLSSAIKARRSEMTKKTKLTIYEGEEENSTESSSGDVLIFPDMIKYRRLTQFDLDNFVEQALLKDTEWLPHKAERITESYVFVCTHGSRDQRCGVCGSLLVDRFKDEIVFRGLQDQVRVRPCSHIGGHKYAGNVIIFSRNMNGEVNGHWYGYVAPDDVPLLLDEHIGKDRIVHRLWRGQMGLSQHDQKKAHNH